MYAYNEANRISQRYLDGVIASMLSPFMRKRAEKKGYAMSLYAWLRRILNLRHDMRRSLTHELGAQSRGSIGRDPGASWKETYSKLIAVEDSIRYTGGLFVAIGGMMEATMETDELLDVLGVDERDGLPEKPTALQVWLGGHTKENCVVGCVYDFVGTIPGKLGAGNHLAEHVALKMEAEVLEKLPADPWIDARWKMGLSNLVCRIRREARKADETRDALWADKWHAERETRKLSEDSNPFKARMAAQRSLQAQAYSEPIKRTGDVLKAQADRMIALAPRLDAAFSLDELFDLFNTNPMERAKIRSELEGENEKAVKILAVYNGDSSAMYRNEDMTRGLGAAMMTNIIKRLHSTPEGRAASDEAFQEFFGDLPIRKGYMQPDGTFELAKPELSVIEGGLADDGDLSPSRTLH